MLSDLRAMALYVLTVDTGSFSGAAQRVNLSPSVISHHIKNLEDKHNVTLLYRSTRQLKQTPQGREFYRHAKAMLESAQAAQDCLYHDINAPLQGSLTLSMPSAFVQSPLNHIIADFKRQHPKIDLTLLYNDNPVDLIAQGIDVAFRSGYVPDSALKQKKIYTLHRKIVCAPDAAQHIRDAQHPAELAECDWIHMTMMPCYRDFYHHKKGTYRLHHHSSTHVNAVEAMVLLTEKGLGLSTPPDYMVAEALKTGRLVEILPQWQAASLDTFAVYATALRTGSLSAHLLAFIQERI